MPYFTGKNAVVTGAGSGIGRALALELNAIGCHLWLSDIDSAGLDETLAQLTNSAARCDIRVLDVTDRIALQRWAMDIGARLPSVDLVVNNAGVALSATASDTKLADFEWLMNINFWGVVHGCQAFLPLLGQAERSHLINLSSVFGLIGVPTQSAYNAAKFAVRGYSEALRQELALSNSPVLLCCVHPGGVNTNIARRARNSDPQATPESQQAQFEPHVHTSAEAAARQIIRAAERGQPRLLIGFDARIIDWIVRLFPSLYPRFLKRSLANIEVQQP